MFARAPPCKLRATDLIDTRINLKQELLLT